jgi:hypothetical protein
MGSGIPKNRPNILVGHPAFSVGDAVIKPELSRT